VRGNEHIAAAVKRRGNRIRPHTVHEACGGKALPTKLRMMKMKMSKGERAYFNLNDESHGDSEC
jgi:hypothetical protein